MRYLPIYGDMAVELPLAMDAGRPECALLIQRDGKPVYDWGEGVVDRLREAGLSEKGVMESAATAREPCSTDTTLSAIGE